MKKQFIYLFLLLPVTSFSQYLKWVSEDADSTLLLKKVTEKFLQVTLTKANEKKDKRNVDFINKSCLCEFLYSVSKQKMKGKKGKKKHLAVNKILIVGPEEKVKKMYTEYFYPLVKPCSNDVTGTSLMYNDVSLGYYSLTMHGEKLAEIILHPANE